MGRARRLAPLLFAVAGLACGRKLAPEPPLRVVPARVEPLRVTQEGSDVVLRFPFPAKTSQGAALTGLTKVTVYREISPAPPGAPLPPAPRDADERERDEKAFRQRAEVLRELSREELDAHTVGADLVVRDPMVPLYEKQRLGRVFLRYGVTATRDRKRTSGLSPLVALLPRVPPAEPLGLSATVEEGRVCLDWYPPVAMLDGSRPATVAAYAVYRRELGEPEYDTYIGVATQGPTYVDTSVQAEKRYLYTVRGAPTTDLPPVLGPPCDEVLVDTHDVFPPAPPEGLLVLAEDAGNRLVFSPSLSRDLLGYRVYRREGPSWVPVSGTLEEPSFLDRGAPRGARYSVTAVDRTGNESERAEPAPEKRP